MEFRWIEWDIDKVIGHSLVPEEVAQVVEDATDPYPQHRGADKFLVWVPTAAGRLRQVVFLLSEDDAVFVIHARPLTRLEKQRQQRQIRRGRRS